MLLSLYEIKNFTKCCTKAAMCLFIWWNWPRWCMHFPLNFLFGVKKYSRFFLHRVCTTVLFSFGDKTLNWIDEWKSRLTTWYMLVSMQCKFAFFWLTNEGMKKKSSDYLDIKSRIGEHLLFIIQKSSQSCCINIAWT